MQRATTRVQQALRPKTARCYDLLFRNFVGFCVCNKINIIYITIDEIMAYMEYLVENGVSVNMVANNISAIRAKFVMYGLPHDLLHHPRIQYFIKSLKINRPLTVTTRNIMSLSTLETLVQLCESLPSGISFKAIFLIAFFVFLRISNVAPQSLSQFDPSRHLTPADVKISKKYMKLIIKWSKTMQTRDRAHTITLPKLYPSPLCPVTALISAMSQYSPGPQDPLFQVRTPEGYKPITESRLRKVLSKLIVQTGLPKGHFTFHTFRRSGATLAYNAHVPIQSIKSHGSWTSDCVWTYIQQNNNLSADIASSFAKLINA